MVRRSGDEGVGRQSGSEDSKCPAQDQARHLKASRNGTPSPPMRLRSTRVSVHRSLIANRNCARREPKLRASRTEIARVANRNCARREPKLIVATEKRDANRGSR